MKKTALIIALGTITGIALSAQPDHRGPRGERPPVEDIAVQVLADFDADSSGGLNLIEFEDAIREHRQQMGRRGPRGGGRGQSGAGERPERAERPERTPEPERVARMQEHLTQVFADADTDFNGTLDQNELVTALTEMRPKRPGGRRGPQGG